MTRKPNRSGILIAWITSAISLIGLLATCLKMYRHGLQLENFLLAIGLGYGALLSFLLARYPYEMPRWASFVLTRGMADEYRKRFLFNDPATSKDVVQEVAIIFVVNIFAGVALALGGLDAAFLAAFAGFLIAWQIRKWLNRRDS